LFFGESCSSKIEFESCFFAVELNLLCFPNAILSSEIPLFEDFIWFSKTDFLEDFRIDLFSDEPKF